jgi:hypothetical protein
MVGGAELNPGPQMKEKPINFMVRERREERYMQVVRNEQSNFDTGRFYRPRRPLGRTEL